MTDKLDAAIAAEAAKPKPVDMLQFNAIISSTHRPATIVLPEDATDAEILEVIGWIAVVVMGAYHKARATAGQGRIEIARTMPR